jgi:hypothetical protein
VYHRDDMIDVFLVGSRTEGDHLIVCAIRESCLDLGLLLLLVWVHSGHIQDWGSCGDDSPLSLRVLKPFRRALRTSTHDQYEKHLGLQKKSLERTPWRFLLDPNKRVTQYLRHEQNLES